MPSSLTWIDHDSAARERTQRILALFHEREARDELGLGAVLGSISDQLFPGTSTIQTRLRYMFFVPWLFASLDEKDAARLERASKEGEQELISALLASGEKAGVLGQRAREGLKRYPSEVYWAGLGSWKIRAFPGSREDLRSEEVAASAWDRELPPPPPEFPEGASFKLTVEEASYVRDKLRRHHGESLLTHLAFHPFDLENAEAPWELPDDALRSTRDLVDEARRFAIVMRGAAFLYNLMLAERAESEEYRERYRTALVEWQSAAAEQCRGWKLEAFWPKVLGRGHGITPLTREFVAEWVAIAGRGSFEAVTAGPAQQLVQRREMRLKGAQSRFRSLKALQRWGGAAGVSLNTYRWGTARQFLVDLYGAEG
jgi:hypothetical protein